MLDPVIPALVVSGLVLGVLAWLFLASRSDDARARTAGPRPGDRDRGELEAAEREVQEASDEDDVKDWGPGAARPRPPELL